MNTDLETRLQQQALREVPREWRSEILQNATRAAQPNPTEPISRNFIGTLSSHISALLWPCPKAWAGLAAIWIVIGAVNFSTAEPKIQHAKVQQVSVPKVMMAGRMQQWFLAELDNAERREPAERPKTFVPRPRSEGRFLMVPA